LFYQLCRPRGRCKVQFLEHWSRTVSEPWVEPTYLSASWSTTLSGSNVGSPGANGFSVLTATAASVMHMTAQFLQHARPQAYAQNGAPHEHAIHALDDRLPLLRSCCATTGPLALELLLTSEVFLAGRTARTRLRCGGTA
jgi:hypothetical protein